MTKSFGTVGPPRAMSNPRAIPEECDVVVVGAGPAGSTAATLLRKYRPGTRVVLFERDTFPRHRIGESLLVDVNRILADMGCLDEVNAAGFSRKWGVNFASGTRRRRVRFDWKPDAEKRCADEATPEDYTFHVDRIVYDAILAERAEAVGAEVHFGTKVLGPIQEDGRVVGVTVAGPDGPRPVRAKWVIDAGGDAAPVTRALGGRNRDPALRNVAVYAYVQGVRWIPGLTGTRDHPRTAILTHPEGWIWIIPLRDGLASVGFVTHITTHQANKLATAEETFWHRLRTVREFDELLSGAEIVDYGTGQSVHVVQDFSSVCDQLGGPGWTLVGDAAGFIDPILSTGCYLGQSHAQFVASGVADILDGRHDEEEVLETYASIVRENLSAFREVAYLFYRFSVESSDWWRSCSEALARRRSVASSDDEETFLAFLTGFQQRLPTYDGALASLGASFITEVGDSLFDGGLPTSGETFDQLQRATRRALRDGARPRLRSSVIESSFLLPRSASGRLERVLRVTTPDATPDTIAYKVYAPAELSGFTALLDGKHTCEEIAAAFGEPSASLVAAVAQAAERLVCMGAAEVAYGAPSLASGEAATDLCGRPIGAPAEVAAPRCTDEVATIVRDARTRRRAVVPVGARTAYWHALDVAGAVALDTRHLDALEPVTPSAGAVWVGAGALVRDVQAHLSESGYMLRAHPDAFGDTSIGAMVATGFAAGIGAAQQTIDDLVAAVEFVDGTGEVVTAGAAAALGHAPFERVGLPDLSGLVMAAGGALGVVTRVALRVRPAPWMAQLDIEPEASAFWSGSFALAERLRHTGMVHLLRATHTLTSGAPQHRVTVVLTSDVSAEERDARVAFAARAIEDAFGAGPSDTALGGPADMPALVPQRTSAWEDSEREAFVGLDVITDYRDPQPLLSDASKLVGRAARLRYRSLRTALYFGANTVNLGLHWAVEPAARPEALALADSGADVLLAHPVVPYRIGRTWGPKLWDRLDPGYADALQRVKAALDPDGILHPGAGIVLPARSIDALAVGS